MNVTLWSLATDKPDADCTILKSTRYEDYSEAFEQFRQTVMSLVTAGWKLTGVDDDNGNKFAQLERNGEIRSVGCWNL